ncbi:MAG TPA: SRPBCC domain-containing protein [Streptosporangiaceae bacterium]
MELEHSFTVPVPKNRAWDVLLDVERVAPCMPGATLDSVDGDEIHGRIKVKVGPINMMYAGTARFIEKDAEAGVVTLEASGKETRGAGTASASVHSVLEDRGAETHVRVKTTLNVTGKPAQFGRGVMNEVSGKLLNIFAANLAATIARDEGAGGEGGAAAGGAAGTEGSSAEGAAGGSAAAGGAAAQTATAGTAATANGVAGHAAAAPGTGTPVEELKLPPRATASLQREGLRTAGQVAAKTEDELLAIDGIGPASLVDIKDKLGELGLALTAGTGGPAAGPAQAAPAATPASAGPAAAAPTGSAPAGMAASAAPAASAAHQATPREAAHQLEDDALNLLKVAGLPVLKRAAPVLLAVAAALLIGLTRRARRRKR